MFSTFCRFLPYFVGETMLFFNRPGFFLDSSRHSFKTQMRHVSSVFGPLCLGLAVCGTDDAIATLKVGQFLSV